MASSTQNISDSKADPENLYHIIFTTSHIPRVPNSKIEKIRIPVTYHSLAAAKVAAHSCLFEAGYQREWLSQYEVNPVVLERHSTGIHRRISLVVLAVAHDGTTFCICISTTSNIGYLTIDNEDGRIAADLYYVVRTNIDYADGDEGYCHDINIEGAFTNYKDARSFAHTTLLSEEDRITKESFAEYNEAGDSEKDCGLGENVVVHAAGINGESYLTSIIKGKEIESVKLAEASIRAS